MGAYEIALANCQAAQEAARLRPPLTENRDLNARNPAYWLGLTGNTSKAGVSVTPGTAMRTSAVWACVRVLSTSYAVLPLHTLRNKTSGGKELAVNSTIYNMLHRTPNPEQTSFLFRQVAMAHICLYGNAYAEIEFDNFGNPVALWPIPPWCCKPLRTIKGELFYHALHR
jgi:phage portal protein BeeE